MHPVLTEMMVRERRAELERTAGGLVVPDGRRAPVRSPRRAEPDASGRLFARLRPKSRARRRRHGEADVDARGRAILPESSPRSSAG